MNSYFSTANQSTVQIGMMPQKTGRRIHGISAILLPIADRSNGDSGGDSGGELCIDWRGFEDHVTRTIEAGLVPAINMDTGYANLISEEVRGEALERTSQIVAGGNFVAGAYVADQPGDAFDQSACMAAIDPIMHLDGLPILFQSHGLTAGQDEEIWNRYDGIARRVDQFYAFELSHVFAPFGKIYSIELYEQLLKIPQCTGAKHSSLRREPEWQRLAVRDRVRPDFRVFTGNDLAIDMVRYGSDYLLGLSTFCPDAFAVRDAYWAAEDPRFEELNDLLQYLGFFAFRDPVPAYKHDAAMYLHLAGQIASPEVYPGAPVRPGWDREVLADIRLRIDQLT